MEITCNEIKIVLTKDEIEDFKNIVLFALDLQAERDKENKPCMYESELKLANELVDILEKISV